MAPRNRPSARQPCTRSPTPTPSSSCHHASKRRLAELVEIIAGFEPLLEAVPGTSRLIDTIRRLSAHGLVQVEDDRFSPTAAGQQLMVGLPKRTDTAGLVTHLRGKLAAFDGPAGFQSVHLGQAQAGPRSASPSAPRPRSPARTCWMPKPRLKKTPAAAPGVAAARAGAEPRLI